jgi:hypothetical protein
MLAFFGMLAYSLISFGLFRNNGHYDPLALVLIILGLALVASSLRRAVPPDDDRYIHASVVLAIIVAALQLRYAFASWIVGIPSLAMGVVGLLYFWKRRERIRLWLWPIALVLFAAVNVLAVLYAPPPNVDVWSFQQTAAELLLAGENPYSHLYPNIYDNEDNYGERLLVDGKIRSFPYPPLSLAFVAPGRFLGDVRWSFLAAMLLGPVLLMYAARKQGLPKGSRAELLAIAFLANPLNPFIARQSWTEPLLALSATLLIGACATRSRWTWLAAACVLASKQYGFLVLVPFWIAGYLRTLHVVLAALAAALTFVPFLIWDMEGVVWGSLWFHVYNAFRPDALSVPALLNEAMGWTLPSWIGFAAAGLVALVSVLGPGKSLSRSTLSAAAVLLAFFLFGKNAFCNYYWLALYLIVAGALLRAAELSNPPR